MMFIQFEDADAARDALSAAVEYLVNVDGYSREQITDAVLMYVGDQFDD